jgi:hypothetical protein
MFPGKCRSRTGKGKRPTKDVISNEVLRREKQDGNSSITQCAIHTSECYNQKQMREV